MTVVDRISFNFRMTDEQFARDLYADWDGFCRRCVTEVMENFFSPYDSMDSYMEIGRLDLDLGGINQENFYDEFPVRLREALERNFIPLSREAADSGISSCIAPDGLSSARESSGWTSSRRPDSSDAAEERRFENFLHYLEYGFCMPEWSGYDFDPGKEQDFFKGRDYIGRIASLIVSGQHAFDRLSMLTGDSDSGLDILHAVISSDAIGEYEKRRHIAATLERFPQTVIRLIHETGESGTLDSMAGLIENPQVRGIMEAETESHAEIGLPEYWYRLYVWLIEYYPFNGVPMFGDKRHFRLHLNRSLLSFIHSRTYPSYLSKSELTVQFLMAVFGAEHYIAVIDIIYHSQPLNPDGSPAGGDSFAWELYYMLMRLSLIKADALNTGRAVTAARDERIIRTSRIERYRQDKAESISKESDSEVLDRLIGHTEGFGQWLEDTDIPSAVKSHLISRLVRENPDELVRWLRAGQLKRHLSALVSLSDDRSLSTLVGRISLQLADIVSGISGYADNIAAHVSWLKGTDLAGFRRAIYFTVLEGIADGSLSSSDTAGELIVRIAERLFLEIAGVVDGVENMASGGTPHAGTVGNGHVDAALEYLIHKLALKAYPSVSESPASGGKYGIPATDAENDSLLSLFSGIRKYIRVRDGRPPFEHFSDNTDEITEWLQGDASPISQKRELLRRLVSARPDKAAELVRDSIIADSSMLDLWSGISDIHTLLELAGIIDGRLSSVTERIVMALQHTGAGDVVIKDIGGAEREKAIAKAILMMITEEYDTDSINTENIVLVFMDTLHFAVTGSREYTAAEHREWESAGLRIVFDIMPDAGISGTAPAESPSAETEGKPPVSPADGQMQETFDRLLVWLMSPSVSDTAKSQLLRRYARWQPGLLWRLIMYSSGSPGGNLSHVAAGAVSVIPKKWASWLDRDILLEMISGISLTLGETLRQTITAVSGKYNITGSAYAEALVIFLASHTSDNVHYIEPQTVVRDYISALEPHIWAIRDTERENIAEAREIRPEVQSQDNSPESDRQRTGVAGIPETIPYSEDRASVRDTIVKEIEKELHVEDTERIMKDAAQPEYIEVPNAGLCLLAVWFIRLFDMLGLLDANADGKKDFRDTAARIRAIFILQRLVTDEKREYREQELSLNRILTGCPFHVPLPRTLELTDTEVQTVESMLAGVKSNWDKLKGTSIKGFQRSFIERPGKLEQREDKWVLYVEERSYDILLDSLPWSYRTIRLPWLKKKINVVWRDKEEFDFENYNN